MKKLLSFLFMPQQPSVAALQRERKLRGEQLRGELIAPDVEAQIVRGPATADAKCGYIILAPEHLCPWRRILHADKVLGHAFVPRDEHA